MYLSKLNELSSKIVCSIFSLNILSKIGGTTYANKIRNILKYILTDTLCQKLSWTGQKGSMSIKDKGFAAIIIGYISENNSCSLHEGQKVTQEWLRHAGDRINYANKKLQCKIKL
ncbi:hypothetical protein ACFW04_013660 [Cataglyphis niger]